MALNDRIFACQSLLSRKWHINKQIPSCPANGSLVAVRDSATHKFQGGFMYLLFGPSMAALVVIAVIQLRDHFVASR
jgi:hypothetical protein